MMVENNHERITRHLVSESVQEHRYDNIYESIDSLRAEYVYSANIAIYQEHIMMSNEYEKCKSEPAI